MKSIVEQIVSNAQSNPHKLALTDGKRSLTYLQLVELIILCTHKLRDECKLNKGDFVIIAADKQIEFPIVYFACHLLGIIVIPIAPDTNENRFINIVNDTKTIKSIGFNNSLIPNLAFKDLADVHIFEQNQNDVHASITPLLNPIIKDFPKLEDLADLMFTTGTTGKPKGVKLSHLNIAASVLNINTFIKNTTDDVELLALPISHSFGLGRLRCALANGQTVVLLGNFANIKRFYRFIEQYKVTGFGMVPSSWAMLKKLSSNKLSEYRDQLKYIEIGSAPMPLEDKRLLISLLPHTRICMHYGLTEASRSCFIEFNQDQEHLNTVGTPSPNVLVDIRDQNGKSLPPNEEGEICICGNSVTLGYSNTSNDQIFFDRYFRTGDWGYIDQDGYITLKSRTKELINVGGKKVSPIEVEEVLKTFDFIQDCACIGVEDQDHILGEVVKAFIVTNQPKLINQDYLDKLIGEQLEIYKHPTLYQIVDHIPKTSSGKIQRLLLKD